jgi:hypothetical protein
VPRESDTACRTGPQNTQDGPALCRGPCWPAFTSRSALGGGAEDRACDQIASDNSLHERTADIRYTNDSAAADVHVAQQDTDASPTDGEFSSADCDGAGDCDIVQPASVIIQQVTDVLQPFQDVTQPVTDVV